MQHEQQEGPQADDGAHHGDLARVVLKDMRDHGAHQKAVEDRQLCGAQGTEHRRRQQVGHETHAELRLQTLGALRQQDLVPSGARVLVEVETPLLLLLQEGIGLNFVQFFI